MSKRSILKALWLRISVSTLPIGISANDGVIFVPMAVLRCLSTNADNFSVRTEVGVGLCIFMSIKRLELCAILVFDKGNVFSVSSICCF